VVKVIGNENVIT